MKLFTAAISSVLLLSTLGLSNAVLRGNGVDSQPMEQSQGAFAVLQDWDVAAINKIHHEHGRELQFADITQCEAATGSLALCSCIFNDGNPFGYCAECGNALVQAEFSLSNTDRFPEWFVEDSVLNLAQTGSYYGLDGVTEYVNFINSVIFTDYSLLQPFVPKFLPNPNFGVTDHTCAVALVANRNLGLNPDLYDHQCLKTTAASTIVYEPTDEASGYMDVSQANVWYPPQVFGVVFGNIRAESAVDWLCGVIESSCPETWTLNNFDNNDNKCSKNYLSLPATEGSLDAIDGKSLGCKILHATFAETNEKHCGHTSFVKQADPSGKVKCQKSEGKTPEDIFSDAELAFFAAVGEFVFGYSGTELLDENPDTCG